MIYTTDNTITLKKVLPKGSTAPTVTTAARHSVSVTNNAGTKVVNPTTSTFTYVAPTATVDGRITITGVPLVDGINSITVTSQDVDDMDTATVTVTQVAKTAVYKVTNSTEVVV